MSDPNTTCYRLCTEMGMAYRAGMSIVRRLGVVHQDREAGRIHPSPKVCILSTAIAIGPQAQTRPELIRGRPAPEELIVLEHGVKYAVQLGSQLSTGMFLNQRPQRAWLTRNAAGLHILNTFAHAARFPSRQRPRERRRSVLISQGIG